MAKRIFITQCLCDHADRHCIMSGVFECDQENHAEIERQAAKVQEQVQAMFACGAFNPWCGICGSRVLKYETGMLRETDREKAMKELAKSQADQFATRAMMDAQGMTHDVQAKN